MSQSPGGRDGSDYRGLAVAGTAITELVAPILIGVWLDQRYDWSPWGIAVGAVIGFVGGIAHLMYLTKQSDKTDRGERGA